MYIYIHQIWLLDRNKHLEKTLEQRRKKKWKKLTDRVNFGYFKPKDLTDDWWNYRRIKSGKGYS